MEVDMTEHIYSKLIKKFKIYKNKISIAIIMIFLAIQILLSLSAINDIYVKDTFIISTVKIRLPEDDQILLCYSTYFYNETTNKSLSRVLLNISKLVNTSTSLESIEYNSNETRKINLIMRSDNSTITLCPMTGLNNTNYISNKVYISIITWTQVIVPEINSNYPLSKIILIGNDAYNNTIEVMIEFKIIPKALIKLIPITLIVYGVLTSYYYLMVIITSDKIRGSFINITNEVNFAYIVYMFYTTMFGLLFYGILVKDTIVFATAQVVMTLTIPLILWMLFIILLMKKYFKNNLFIISLIIEIILLLLFLYLIIYHFLNETLINLYSQLYSVRSPSNIATTLAPLVVLVLGKYSGLSKQLRKENAGYVVIIYYIFSIFILLLPIIGPTFIVHNFIEMHQIMYFVLVSFFGSFFMIYMINIGINKSKNRRKELKNILFFIIFFVLVFCLYSIYNGVRDYESLIFVVKVSLGIPFFFMIPVTLYTLLEKNYLID